MALKDYYSAMNKTDSFVIKPLDIYLMSLNKEDNDRAIDVNGPSQIGACMRARYYARTKTEKDGCAVNARARRIFDNGSGMHERIQHYLKEQGMLVLDEIPVVNDKYNIQGHTDGLLDCEDAYRVLELKSMNDREFNNLKKPKDEHVMQGLVYVFCIESRRKYLHQKYDTYEKFLICKAARMRGYAKYYQHLKGGRKHTREEKIRFQCELHNKMDRILMKVDKPITDVVFLYENKNNQDLKEFLISTKEAQSKVILKDILNDCVYLNDCVRRKRVPQREFESRSSQGCKYCNYKTECWL